MNKVNRVVMVLSGCLLASISWANTTFKLDNTPVAGTMVAQSAGDLCRVAKAAAVYLDKGKAYDPMAITAGITASFGGDLARVKKTLNYLCQVQTEDERAGRKSRLSDPQFIAQHFDMIRWQPDKKQAAQYAKGKPLIQNIPDDKILLTKYYVKLAQGSAVKSVKTPYALYAVPHDEEGLSLQQADADSTLTRHRLTKQDVLAGAIEKNKLAEPMVWLSRYDLEDSLMQGTVKVDVDGKSQFYNVHRNNGIGYKRNLKRREQQRYWYFKKTNSVLGYGKDSHYKIPVYPMVTVAGDLAHLGLGKLIMLSHQGESRLAVLADTGGAFDNNQYQLDYLGGYFKSWKDYLNTYRTFPDYFEARILLLKE